LNIAIVGDGIAGRTLHRLLKAQAMAVELFGERKKTHCRIRSCGFGTSAACVDFVRRLGIAPEEYVVSRHPGITIAGRRIPGDIYSIDKPRLLAALSADVRYDPPSLDQYDLVVDATGVRRAVAPPIPAAADKIAAGYQYRTRIEGRPLLSFDPIKGGYLWTIPLGDGEAHIGGASAVLPRAEVEDLTRQYLRRHQPGKVICSCSEELRVSGPLFPLVSGNVVTVGESAGLVVPFGAAGIHTAFESAAVLARHIGAGDLAGYEVAIRKRFGRLNAARRIVDRLETTGHLPVAAFGTAWWTLRYQGLRPGVADLFHIRRKLLAVHRGAGRP
jgi:2-polyprenyl-6-methoxyphenol hydroxylase-like FAD-dependent oxidoreductase